VPDALDEPQLGERQSRDSKRKRLPRLRSASSRIQFTENE
jgi:hypothetical protein